MKWTKCVGRMVLSATLAMYAISTVLSGTAIASQDSDARAEFPGRRIGGGTRGGCATDQSLVAINPANNLGVTGRDRPTLYFSLPTVDQSKQVEFLLQDETGNFVYNSVTDIVPNQSLVSIQIPDEVVDVNHDYRWYFSVLCVPSDRSQNLVTNGWLRQIPAGRATLQLPERPSADTADTTLDVDATIRQARSYQLAGLWSDAIAVIVELHQQYPDNDAVRAEWVQLLELLDLSAVISYG